MQTLENLLAPANAPSKGCPVKVIQTTDKSHLRQTQSLQQIPTTTKRNVITMPQIKNRPRQHQPSKGNRTNTQTTLNHEPAEVTQTIEKSHP